MATISDLSKEEQQFLQKYLPPAISHAASEINSEGVGNLGSSNGQPPKRPFVTLTYACSLDSMISLGPGLRTAISGPETKSMTHYLRFHHDSILVGAGTAVADNPSLNCRCAGATLDTQPRPILVDPNQRFCFHGSRLIRLAQENQGKRPWIIRKGTSGEVELLLVDAEEPPTTAVHSVDKAAGISEKIDWTSILESLKLKGINSVMIEGGATIINDLLSQSSLIDSVIITIAPTWLGQGGTAVSPATRTGEDGHRINAAYLDSPSWKQFGQDIVLCGKPKQ